MPIIQGDFPFEEIRREDGNYFDTAQQARDAGYVDSQIWSIVSEGDTWIYGPCHHYVNRLGYIATKEHHDGNTYYEETYPEEPDDENDSED